MQRSKRLDGTMDRHWEAERRGAKRAEARLSNGLQEIQDAQTYYVNSMTREQKKLQMDLVKMKQAKSKTSTRKGVPPQGKPALHPAASAGGQLPKCGTQAESTRKQSGSRSKGPVTASGSSITLQMRFNDFMDGVSKKGKTEPGTNMADIRNAMARKLSITGNPTGTSEKGQDLTNGLPSAEASPGSTLKPSLHEASTRPPYINLQAVKSRRGSLFKDKVIFDEDTYAPDGGLRTLHTMPDLMDSLEEAKKARYIRHKNKMESERELSVQEIFQREETQDADQDYSNDTVN